MNFRFYREFQVLPRISGFAVYAQALGHEGGSQQRGTDLIVPEEDARGLAAYLELFAQIFREASLADIEAWTSELEGLVNVRPLWEIFFQLMCHPVPQASSNPPLTCPVL